MSTAELASGVPTRAHNVRALEGAFVVSGFCGLIYESIWSHYLKLFVGHAAYAQSIVLVVFIGGMALGAWAAGRFSSRIRFPLLAYAAVELAVGAASLAFHGVYVRVTDWSLASLLPFACAPESPCALQWSIAGLLILPQSILLGTTFPLMTAAVLRISRDAPGRRIANLYFLNSIGAVAGVLTAGFYLIPTVGLPGTLMTAGLMNVAVAIAVYWIAKGVGEDLPLLSTRVGTGPASGAKTMLAVAALTGLSSFVYEVVWIRMLALVVGASTQAFEIMLAAFILGLALGGLWIRSRIDRLCNPVGTLAMVQVLMGIAAVGTLPLYDATFDVLAWTIGSLARSEGGYALYNVTSQAIAMAVMLPATVLAGMTLPLVTSILLQRGSGERAVGYVYAANTVGAIVGVIVAVHLALPYLGAKNALAAGAAIDIAIGAWLLFGWMRAGANAAGASAVTAGIAALIAVSFLVDLAPERTASGVFRHGRSHVGVGKEILFYRDGKTATVSVVRDREHGVSIATNGKVDAAIADAGASPSEDEYTMAMLGTLPLLYKPELKRAAVIGFGSGMTTATLLASPHLERVDTIEIEREMVNGARQFGKRVERAFTDPRSNIVFDDAKSFFARGRERYDVIVSEPSNPWVSGVVSLFTVEFYRRIKQYLTEDGFLIQWMHAYEITDELVASIMRAIDAEFPAYTLYSTQPGDLIVVAGKTDVPRRLDGAALDYPALKENLQRLALTTLGEFEVRRVASRPAITALLSQQPHALNSDFYPIVDTGAPRARFMGAWAGSMGQLSVAPVPLVEMLEGRDPESVPSRFSVDGPPTGRRGEAVEAQAFVRWFVDGSEPPASSPVVTTLARDGAMVRARLWSCSSLPPSVDPVLSLAMVAGQVNPHSPRLEAARFWSEVTAAPCFDQLTARERRWIDLFRAVADRAPSRMAEIGSALLASEKDMSVDLRQYATLAVATGQIRQGRGAAARELIDQQLPRLRQQRDALPWLLALRGSTFQEPASPARAANQASPGGKG